MTSGRTKGVVDIYQSEYRQLPTLTVLMPVFNEQTTVARMVERVLKHPMVTELIVINDGSTDGTTQILQTLSHKKLRLIEKENGGKGSAIRAGLAIAKSEFTLIQDADLEYDPEDIALLLEPVIKRKSEVVYGSRFLGAHTNLLFWHMVGNVFLNLVVNMLYNTTLSDMETCYKLMPTRMLQSLNLQAKAFDLEPEITCKLLRRGVRIYEVPITYVGRDFSQGKKITWVSGIEALGVIAKLRVGPQ
jgi:glycosyltransferase involved in cell wall biosynthesis